MRYLIHEKFLAFGQDSLIVDIASGEDDVLILACVLTIDLIEGHKD